MWLITDRPMIVEGNKMRWTGALKRWSAAEWKEAGESSLL
jgi:hypothetical protein